MNYPTIAFVNHKGGTAKTESVLRIGRQYALLGMFPTLIDIDPQANLTRRCNLWEFGHKPAYRIGDVLGGAAPARATLGEAEREICFGADRWAGLVASDIQLENVAVGLLQRNFNRLTALANAIAEVPRRGPILIDTPPNAGVLTLNALVAATHVVICADPEIDAIAGVRRIVEIVGEIDRERGKAPHILGVIATRVDGQLVRHQEGMAQLERAGMPVLLGTIPQRAGRDADEKLDAAYGPVAERIWRMAGVR